MNLVADESVDGPIVSRLRQDGHSVWYVAEETPSITDDHVLRLANDQNAVLLTADKDFGEIVFRLNQTMSGIVLIRLAGVSLDVKAQCVSAVFRDHAMEMRNAFTVIGRKSLRIRRRT